MRRHQLMAHPTYADETETVPVEGRYRAKRRRRNSGPLSIGGCYHNRVEGPLDRDERPDDSGYGVSAFIVYAATATGNESYWFFALLAFVGLAYSLYLFVWTLLPAKEPAHRPA